MSRNITKCGEKTSRKRIGLQKKVVQKNADRALKFGISRNEATGRLRKYFDHLFIRQGIGADIRVYAGYVYIFTRKNLVTTFILPKAHQDAALKIMKRKQEGESCDEMGESNHKSEM